VPLPEEPWNFISNPALATPRSYLKSFDAVTAMHTITVSDTAGNTADQSVAELKIDTIPPICHNCTTVPPTVGPQTVTLKFTESIGKSGIHTGTPKVSSPVPMSATINPFDDYCNESSFSPGTGAPLSSEQTQEIISASFDPATQKIYYCVLDNAGNVRKGAYPDTSVSACFSDDTTTVDLRNYEQETDIYGLYKRVDDSINNEKEKRGYLLSDPARRAQTLSFQSKLASNIKTYITSKYCATLLGDGASLSLSDITSDGAYIKPLTSG
jgi:hypothetical protein